MLPSKVLMTTKNRQQWCLVTGAVVCWRKAFGSGRGQRLGPKIHSGHKRTRVEKCYQNTFKISMIVPGDRGW